MNHLGPSELRAVGHAMTMTGSMVGVFVAIFAGVWGARRSRLRQAGATGFRREARRGRYGSGSRALRDRDRLK